MVWYGGVSTKRDGGTVAKALICEVGTVDFSVAHSGGRDNDVAVEALEASRFYPGVTTNGAVVL